MKRIAVAVLLLVVVGVVLFGVRRLTGFASGGGKDTVAVQLTGEGAACAAMPVDDHLGGAWKNKIHWNVTNNCNTPQYVTMREYRKRDGSSLGEPEHVVDPDPASTRQLARGDTDKVDAKIDKFNWNPFGDKIYKYKICVGPNPNPSTNCLDPDVDVWPF